MSTDPSSPRSRRALLAAGLGAGAATVATAIVRPIPAAAASGGNLVMGQENDSGTDITMLTAASGVTTLIVNSTSASGRAIAAFANQDTALYGSGAVGVQGVTDSGVGMSGEASAAGTGVRGRVATKTGVYGISGYDTAIGAAQPPAAPTGVGVFGIALKGVGPAGVGVRGDSLGGFGVYGHSSGSSTDGAGVYGHATAGIGVAGQADTRTGVYGVSGDLVPAPLATGVYGYAAQNETAAGVFGESTAGDGVRGVVTDGTAIRGTATATGTGVRGEAVGGSGVAGTSEDNYGVLGVSTNFTGVYGGGMVGVDGFSDAPNGVGGEFRTISPKVGTALHAAGRVKFDHASGIATIARGARSVVVTPGTNLGSKSAVVATLMGTAGGTTTVHRVSVSTSTDKFTILLTAAATRAVRVAWHVFDS